MAFIFENSNFQLVEKVGGKLMLSITKNGIGFSKQVLSRLNYSHYVQVYINKIDKQMAIVACDKDDFNAMRFVPSKKTKVNSLRWNNPSFTNSIRELVNKELAGNDFACEGRYVEEEKAILFDFASAKPLKKGT